MKIERPPKAVLMKVERLLRDCIRSRKAGHADQTISPISAEWFFVASFGWVQGGRASQTCTEESMTRLGSFMKFTWGKQVQCPSYFSPRKCS